LYAETECYIIGKERKMDCHNDLEGESNNMDIIENPIDPSVQREYQDLSGSMDFGDIDYQAVLTRAQELFGRGIPIESKKRILILLAHLGTIESAKILERYLRVSEEGLKDWAVLSLKECRAFLESVLLKEEGGFVSTGLGGKGRKLRYYFVVSTRKGRPLTDEEREDIEKGFTKSSDDYRAEIEEITIETNYAMIGILVPMDAAVGEVIEEGIRQCNRMEEVLSTDYYVTNVKKPVKEEISKYLEDT